MTWDQIRDVEAEKAAGIADFDARYAETLARLGLGQQVPAQSRRRAHIALLAEQGATEGERQAAQAALERFDVSHAEQDRMQRGGNWSEE